MFLTNSVQLLCSAMNILCLSSFSDFRLSHRAVYEQVDARLAIWHTVGIHCLDFTGIMPSNSICVKVSKLLTKMYEDIRQAE